MVAHELVTNALTHAFPDGRAGVVRIALRPLSADRAMLSVVDNGVGYDPAAVNPRRLGLWLIGGLSDQVKGHLTIAAESGVDARLEFPTR
jgi:two-component sensor histidine kinase